VPLPDANKRSPRVYTNLQNTDLANVTFTNVEATGDPILIEEANEDELRRIVLVNLARMCVAGEWTGLLEAGGGGMDQVAVLPAASSKYYSVSQSAPWGSLGPATGTDVINYNNPVYFPFVCPNDGDVAGLSINLTSAAGSGVNFLAGIYSSSDGLPSALLGSVTMDMNVGTGNIRNTSFSSTVTLVRGTTYWMGWTRSTFVAFTLSTVDFSSVAGLGPTKDVENSYSSVLEETGTNNTLPATVTAANLLPTDEERVMFNLDW